MAASAMVTRLMVSRRSKKPALSALWGRAGARRTLAFAQSADAQARIPLISSEKGMIGGLDAGSTEARPKISYDEYEGSNHSPELVESWGCIFSCAASVSTGGGVGSLPSDTAGKGGGAGTWMSREDDTGSGAFLGIASRSAGSFRIPQLEEGFECSFISHMSLPGSFFWGRLGSASTGPETRNIVS